MVRRKNLKINNKLRKGKGKNGVREREREREREKMKGKKKEKERESLGWPVVTARRSNQSILKEISAGCSLEGLTLKLKLQYFGHLMQRADSCEKTPMLGKIEGRRRG